MRRLGFGSRAACLLLLVLMVGSATRVWRWGAVWDDWFPLREGDRWTYVDPGIPDPVVFEVTGRDPGRPDAFVVERRAGRGKVTFILSRPASGVWIHEATGGRFEGSFQEFRLPPREGDEWTYSGRFAGMPLKVVSRTEWVEGRQCRVVEESSISGTTTFTLSRGKGVVRLRGKGDDPHGFGDRVFDWTLEEFERRG